MKQTAVFETAIEKSAISRRNKLIWKKASDLQRAEMKQYSTTSKNSVTKMKQHLKPAKIRWKKTTKWVDGCKMLLHTNCFVQIQHKHSVKWNKLLLLKLQLKKVQFWSGNKLILKKTSGLQRAEMKQYSIISKNSVTKMKQHLKPVNIRWQKRPSGWTVGKCYCTWIVSGKSNTSTRWNETNCCFWNYNWRKTIEQWSLNQIHSTEDICTKSLEMQQYSITSKNSVTKRPSGRTFFAQELFHANPTQALCELEKRSGDEVSSTFTTKTFSCCVLLGLPAGYFWWNNSKFRCVGTTPR